MSELAELTKKVSELGDSEKTQLIIDVVSNSNVLWLNSFIKAFEEKFQISGAAFVPGVAVSASTAASAEAKVEEKTSFDVFLKDPGSNKIQVIKAIRSLTNIGLKEAKELVDAPGKAPVKSGVPRDEAEKIVKELEAAGAKAEIK